MKSIPEHVTDREKEATIEAIADVVDADLTHIALRLAFYKTAMDAVTEVGEGLGGFNEVETALYDQVQDVRTKLSELYGALEDVAEAIATEEALEDEENGDEENGDGDEE